jgi:acyl carrier protein
MNMSTNDVAGRFATILGDLMNDSTEDSETASPTEDAMDGDSLTRLKLILALEEEFGIRFSLGEMTSLQSPSDFIGAITRRIEST